MTNPTPIILLALLFTLITLAALGAGIAYLAAGKNGFLRRRFEAQADYNRQALQTLRTAITQAQASGDRDQFNRLVVSYRDHLAASRSFGPGAESGDAITLVYDDRPRPEPA